MIAAVAVAVWSRMQAAGHAAAQTKWNARGHKGGQAILNLRGWSQSERFDQTWALLGATL